MSFQQFCRILKQFSRFAEFLPDLKESFLVEIGHDVKWLIDTNLSTINDMRRMSLLGRLEGTTDSAKIRETGQDFWCVDKMFWSGAATVLNFLGKLYKFLQEGL